MQYNDHRRDLRPLPSDSAKRIEWVVARHEVKINNALLAWHGAASASNAGQRTLTAEQQSELQSLLIEMAIKVGEAEGSEYLAGASSPRQFEIEVVKIMDAIAAEALQRWNSLSRDFNSEPGSDFELRVRDALKPVGRQLIRDAWSAHEKRLAAECSCSGSENGGDAPTRARDNGARRQLVAQRLERLRIERGMSVEHLAVDAHLDKKTVIDVLHGRRRAMPNTLMKIAGALRVHPSELAS